MATLPIEQRGIIISENPLMSLKNFTSIEKIDEEETKYTISDDGKTYTIYVEKDYGDRVYARVDRVTNNKDVIFALGDKIQVEYSDDQIEIKYVFLQTRKVCTRTVAYAMKALLHYINERSRFALTGKVAIDSKNPNRAFNCYNRAFELNGFTLDKDEFKRFQNAYVNQTADDDDVRVKFTFSNFRSLSQEAKQQSMTVDFPCLLQVAKQPKLKL